MFAKGDVVQHRFDASRKGVVWSLTRVPDVLRVRWYNLGSDRFSEDDDVPVNVQDLHLIRSCAENIQMAVRGYRIGEMSAGDLHGVLSSAGVNPHVCELIQSMHNEIVGKIR